MPEKALIVDSGKNTPSFSPRKTASLPPLKTEFASAAHWDELAIKYLGRYPQPKWSERPTVDRLHTWLYRLDLTERAFLKSGAYRSLQDCIDLNPTWPLRALIGLALELRHYEQTP